MWEALSTIGVVKVAEESEVDVNELLGRCRALTLLLNKVRSLEEEVKKLQQEVRELKESRGDKPSTRNRQLKPMYGPENWLEKVLLRKYTQNRPLDSVEARVLIDKFEETLKQKYMYKDVRREINPLRVVLMNVGLKTLLDKMSQKDIHRLSRKGLVGVRGEEVKPEYIEKISENIFKMFKNFMKSEFGLGNQKSVSDFISP